MTVFGGYFFLGFTVFLRVDFVPASSTIKDSSGIPYSFASFAAPMRAFVKLVNSSLWIAASTYDPNLSNSVRARPFRLSVVLQRFRGLDRSVVN